VIFLIGTSLPDAGIAATGTLEVERAKPVPAARSRPSSAAGEAAAGGPGAARLARSRGSAIQVKRIFAE
jgi:hypothetical protein